MMAISDRYSRVLSYVHGFSLALRGVLILGAF